MPQYQFKAKDKTGKTVAGEISAANREETVDLLRKREFIPITIREAEKKSSFNFSVGGKVKIDDIAIFSRQLATLVEAGIPVVAALDALNQQAENRTLKTVIGKVRDDVEAGAALSQSLAKHPRIFDNLYINMVRAGESSGLLDEILARVASFLEKMSSLQRKVKASMVYPAVVICVAIAITTFLLVKVVPTFKQIFDMLGGELPLPTKILLGISDFLRHYILFGFVGLVIFVIVFIRFIKTEQGRFLFDSIALKLPVFGSLFRKFSIAKFSRTLSTLVRSGVPILVSIEIVAKTCGNKVLERAIIKAGQAIKDGKSIAEPLAESKVMPAMPVRMIAIGEQTGELEKMLTKIADFYDDQVDTAVGALMSLIEPVIIVFLGGVIGSIVIAIFLPIFKITEILAG